MQFNMIECGKRIKELRLCRSMTQEQLALKLGIHTMTLSNLENGRRSSSIDLLIDIAQAFDVTLDYLILGRKACITTRLAEETEDALNHLKNIQRILQFEAKKQE